MRRVVLFIITVLLMAVVIIMFEKSASSFSENLTAFKSVLYPVLLISSVFISKVYRIFTDTDYCGVVKKVKVKTVTDNKSAAKPTREQMYRKNIIYLTIEDETGKTFRKRQPKLRSLRSRIQRHTRSEIQFCICMAPALPLYSLPRQTRVATVLCAAAQMTK